MEFSKSPSLQKEGHEQEDDHAPKAFWTPEAIQVEPWLRDPAKYEVEYVSWKNNIE